MACQSTERARVPYLCEDDAEVGVQYASSEHVFVFYDGYKHVMRLKQRGKNLVYEGRFYRWHVTLDRDRGMLLPRAEASFTKDSALECEIASE